MAHSSREFEKNNFYKIEIYILAWKKHYQATKQDPQNLLPLHLMSSFLEY